MKILLVLSHPRRRSLTRAIADSFISGASAAGHDVELADLYDERFDPVLLEPDEPDWADEGKTYSCTVRAEMERIRRNDAIVLVFPVWWWSMPAMMKGWIDRVWNFGFAYGSRKLSQDFGLAIGVAAASGDAFSKRGYDAAFEAQIKIGIFDYCGVKSYSSLILHDSKGTADQRSRLIDRAYKIGFIFPATEDLGNLEVE